LGRLYLFDWIIAVYRRWYFTVYEEKISTQLTFYLIKIALSTLLIVLISEVAKRSSFWGAVLASIPAVSVLAIIWLHAETKDIQRVSELSTSIVWLVIPSLALFITLPLFLQRGLNFYLSLFIAIVITVGCYWLIIAISKLWRG
jgi:hypothetical protein